MKIFEYLVLPYSEHITPYFKIKIIIFNTQ